jgi:hypothetical protein
METSTVKEGRAQMGTSTVKEGRAQMGTSTAIEKEISQMGISTVLDC